LVGNGIQPKTLIGHLNGSLGQS